MNQYLKSVGFKKVTRSSFWVLIIDKLGLKYIKNKHYLLLIEAHSVLYC
jgi:hypothetical protein